MTTLHCTNCGQEVCAVESCPTCNAHVPAQIEYHRSSGWSWEQAPMGFCVICGTQISGPPQSACFIATAAFGNANAPEVMVLREFRDNVLVNHACGRLFIQCYYRISPPIAKRLHGHEFLCEMVRRGIRLLLTLLPVRKGY